jgi:hypothetical protein
MLASAPRRALLLLAVIALAVVGAGSTAPVAHLTAPVALAQDTTDTTTDTTTTDTTDTTTDTTDTGGSGNGDDSGIPGWVWAIVGAGIVLVLLLVFALGRRGRGDGGNARGASPGLTARDRQARFGPALNAYQRDGWAVESRGADQAVLTRDRIRKRVWVDEYGELQEELLARQPDGFDEAGPE